MKKLVITLLFSLVTLLSYAQTEHVQFMGIPINGTINQFQQKLQAKGIKYDQAASREVGVGTRVFKGIFAGEDSQFFVAYIPKSKIVYYVGVVIKCYSEDVAQSKLNKFKSLLEDKYVYWEEMSTTDGLCYIIPSKNFTDAIGSVRLWYEYDPTIYPNPYTLYVKYTDYANSILYENSISGDI